MKSRLGDDLITAMLLCDELGRLSVPDGSGVLHDVPLKEGSGVGYK